MFGNRVLLITGGTGSFGNAVLKRFLASDLREIRIFSRDEKKQDDMRKRYDDPKLKFYIGDVRDPAQRRSCDARRRLRFHAAALSRCRRASSIRWRRCAPTCSAPRTCSRRRSPAGVRTRRLPEHRQGGLSDQRDGHLQGDDGKGHGGQVAQSRRHAAPSSAARATAT